MPLLGGVLTRWQQLGTLGLPPPDDSGGVAAPGDGRSPDAPPPADRRRSGARRHDSKARAKARAGDGADPHGAPGGGRNPTDVDSPTGKAPTEPAGEPPSGSSRKRMAGWRELREFPAPKPPPARRSRSSAPAKGDGAAREEARRPAGRGRPVDSPSEEHSAGSGASARQLAAAAKLAAEANLVAAAAELAAAAEAAAAAEMALAAEAVAAARAAAARSKRTSAARERAGEPPSAAAVGKEPAALTGEPAASATADGEAAPTATADDAESNAATAGTLDSDPSTPPTADNEATNQAAIPRGASGSGLARLLRTLPPWAPQTERPDQPTPPGLDELRIDEDVPSYRRVAHRWWTMVSSGPTARRVIAAAPGLAREYLAPVLLAMVITAYLVRFALLSLSVYQAYGMPPFDLAIFDQGIWLLSRFHDPFVTIIGRNLFGDHTSFILFLVVPIYWVWPHVQAILVLQVCIIASAAIPIYLLAVRLTRSRAIAVALASSFLLNPALQWGNMEQFHPESFLVLGITLAIYAAITWRPLLLVVMAVACLLVKEDAALLVAPLGLWVFFRRNRRLGAAMVLAALSYMAVCVEVIQPALLSAPYLYGGRIPFNGPFGAVKTLFTNPAEVWDYVVSPGRPWYLWQMFGAVGFGFLWAPEIAAIAALTLVENYLSTFPYMHQILYHYSLSSVPILVLGSVFAIAALRTRWKRYAAAGVVFGSAVASCTIWGLAPFSLPISSYVFWAPNGSEVHAVNKLIDAIPPNAVVSAQWPFVAHLDHRTTVYVWPNPFWASNYGSNPAADDGPLPGVDAVQYVLEPNPVTGEPDAQVWKSIHKQFKAVMSGGGYTLWRRVRPAPLSYTGQPGTAAPKAS